jgi:DNA repair protein RecN (Recombination protein N)
MGYAGWKFPAPLWYFCSMLKQLRIRDFAIIDTITMNFEPGFNVLTGETGAGKSIIVDALSLTLGARAQTDTIKTGKSETTVEAYFDVIAGLYLERLGIPAGDGVILRRNLSAGGKSRAYINDTMVNVQTLLEIGRSLVDIHGQHEHQSLLSSDNQRAMLDAYGKLIPERAELEEMFQEVQSLRRELSLLTSNIRDKEQRIDLLKFQIGEIDTASLQTGEKEALISERAILANFARLKELTDTAYLLLYSGDGSSSEKLSAALAMIREIARIDHGVAETLDLLESARPLVEDAAVSLRRHKDRYDDDPQRLESVEERLDLIKRLEKKYGEGTEGILRHREEAAAEMEKLTLSDERVRELENELLGKDKRLHEIAARLSSKRKEVAKKIARSVKAVLGELAMEKADFVVEVKAAPLSSAGTDDVDFLFTANKGEPPKSLSRVASGGELSRIMLALKGTLAEVDRIPVLIFDEVDAGIGGRTAESVGVRLKNLAKRHQVLCITHLPQIAAMADHHIMIEKGERKEGVYVTLKELSPGEREEEIARMLSGKVTDISRRHARELLARELRSQEKLI